MLWNNPQSTASKHGPCSLVGREERERENVVKTTLVKAFGSLITDRNWGREWGWVGRRDGDIGMGE